MTDAEPKRRRRGWKILGVVLGAMLLCVVVLYVWASAVADRRFDRIRAELKATVDAKRAAVPSRPVLRGTAEPGNAMDDYKLASGEAVKLKTINKLGDLVSRTAKADPEAGKEAVAAAGPMLAHLRRGAGRAGARADYAWEQGTAMPIPGLLDYQRGINLVVLVARARAEEGNPGEAAGVLLDGCQMGRDVGDDGLMIAEMIGSALLNLTLTEIRDLLAAGRFDAAAIRDLDAGLGVLDGSFPSHARSLNNEALMMGTTFLAEAEKSGWGVARFFHTNAYEAISRSMARAAKAQSLPWGESLREFAAIEEEAKSSWNPLVRMTVPSLLGNTRVHRERLAQLRLLRTALRFKATGELLDLDDPFGTKLKTARSGDALKVWSVGRDGADDGGDGAWKTDGKDIVLELKK